MKVLRAQKIMKALSTSCMSSYHETVQDHHHVLYSDPSSPRIFIQVILEQFSWKTTGSIVVSLDPSQF